MLNSLGYYELCMQAFASLKREIDEAEQYTVQLYNNQLRVEQEQEMTQSMVPPLDNNNIIKDEPIKEEPIKDEPVKEEKIIKEK